VKASRLAAIVVLVVAVMALMSPAFAERGSGEHQPPKDDRVEKPHNPPDPVVEPAQRPATLPFTGGDVLGFVAVGAVAVGTGAALVRRSRRTEQL
jgi:hypothetical protein